MTKARSNATANAAKGDLTVGNGTNLSGVLAVGSNGDTIVADSSTATGLRYQAPVNANPVLNSAFQVWQRGTSISQTASTTPYTADRWQALNGASQANTISRQATGDTTNLPFIQYCARMQRNSGQTGTADMGLFSSFETVNSVAYAGKTVTLSFYARRGANFSATSNILVSRLYVGTGTDQNLLTGYSGLDFAGQNNTLTTTWQRFTITITLPAVTTEIALGFYYTPTGTASTNDYFEITGVQLEVGSVATPFKTYGGTIQGELAACERYFETITPSDLGSLAYAAANGSTFQGQTYNFHTKKRGTPSVTRSAGTVEWWTGGGWTAVAPVLSAGLDNMAWAIDTGTSTSNRLIRQNGTTYQISAEL